MDLALNFNLKNEKYEKTVFKSMENIINEESITTLKEYFSFYKINKKTDLTVMIENQSFNLPVTKVLYFNDRRKVFLIDQSSKNQKILKITPIPFNENSGIINGYIDCEFDLISREIFISIKKTSSLIYYMLKEKIWISAIIFDEKTKDIFLYTNLEIEGKGIFQLEIKISKINRSIKCCYKTLVNKNQWKVGDYVYAMEDVLTSIDEANLIENPIVYTSLIYNNIDGHVNFYIIRVINGKIIEVIN
jgi:hypothetical protein